MEAKTVQEAIEFANNNAIMLADEFLDKAKDYKPNKPSYVCCHCNNGAGKDGTGMQFYRNDKNEPTLKCLKCNHRAGNIINWIGYKELSLNDNDFKDKDFIRVLELIGQKHNFTVSNGTNISVNKSVKQKTKNKSVKEIIAELNTQIDESKDEQKTEIDLSKTPQRIKEYIYTDKSGALIKSKVKIEYYKNNVRQAKEYMQKDLIHSVFNLKGLTEEQKELLYRIDDVEKAKLNNKPLFYVEGEKDADTLHELTLYATTAGSAKPLSDENLKQLQGVKDVIIIPDNDLIGYKSSVAIYKQLKDIGINVSIVNWLDFTDVKGYDITDYIEEQKRLYQDKDIREILEPIISTDGLLQKNTSKIDEYLEEQSKPNTLQGTYERLKQVKFNMMSNGAIKQDGAIKISPNKIAEIIYRTCHCIIINYSGGSQDTNPVAIYDASRGIYDLSNSLIDSFIKTIDENISIAKIEQVKYDLRNMLFVKKKIKNISNDINKVVLANGIYNRITGKLEQFTPNYISTNKLNFKYNPNARHPRFKDGWNFDKWISKDIAQGDKEKEREVWKAFANVVYYNENNKTLYIFYDESSNTGKSTMMEFIANLVGDENTKVANLEQIEERFTPASLVGATVIIGDDNNHGMNLTKSANLKSIVSGDRLQVEKKGKTPYPYIFKSVVIQAMNGFPRFRIDDGLMNRLNIIKFGTSYKGKNINPKVKEEYAHNQELLEYIGNKALKMSTRPFTPTKECLEFRKQIGRLSDDIIAFAEDVIPLLESSKIPTRFLYDLYILWSKPQNNIEKISQNAFTNRIKEVINDLGYHYDGKSIRIKEDEFKPIQDLKNVRAIITQDRQELLECKTRAKEITDKLNKPCKAFYKI